MKTQRTPFTLAVTFGLWLGLILGCSSLRKSTHSSSSERASAPTRISAEDLYKAYAANEAAADNLYQGKMLIVSGTVGDSETPEVGTPSIALVDARQSAVVECFAA